MSRDPCPSPASPPAQPSLCPWDPACISIPTVSPALGPPMYPNAPSCGAPQVPQPHQRPQIWEFPTLGPPHPYATPRCPQCRDLPCTPVPVSPSLSAPSLGTPCDQAPEKPSFAPHPGCPHPSDGTLAQHSWLLCLTGPGAVPHHSMSADSHQQCQESPPCTGTTRDRSAPCAHCRDRTPWQPRALQSLAGEGLCPQAPRGNAVAQLPQMLCAGNKLAAPLLASSSFLPLTACAKTGCTGARAMCAPGWHMASAGSCLSPMGAGTATAPTWAPPTHTGPWGKRCWRPREPTAPACC